MHVHPMSVHQLNWMLKDLKPHMYHQQIGEWNKNQQRIHRNKW
jgi:hypothetical protein